MQWSPLEGSGGDASLPPGSPAAERGAPVAVVVVSPRPLPAAFTQSLQAATRHGLDLVQVSTDAALVSTALSGRVLHVDPGSAYGAAVNAGVYATTAEFVVIAHASVRWGDSAVDQLLAAAQRWPTGAAFGPLIRRPDGAAYPSARNVPTLSHGVGHALFGRWWANNPWSRAYRGDVAPVERPAGWLSGSCLLLRRDAFDAVGGFDSNFVAYFEDVDLGERFAAGGWHNVYVPSAAVQHTGRAVTGGKSPSMTREHHRSAWRYLSRRYAGARWWALRLVLRIGLAIRSRWALRNAVDDEVVETPHDSAA